MKKYTPYFLNVDQLHWSMFVQYIIKSHPHSDIMVRCNIMIDCYGLYDWRMNRESNMDVWFKDQKSKTEFSDLIANLHTEKTLRHL